MNFGSHFGIIHNFNYSMIVQWTLQFRGKDLLWFYRLLALSKSESCSSDPIPTNILKDLLPELLPFITVMCNKSLREGHLPSSQKPEILSPIVKKAGLDADDVQSYQPISNLTFMLKLIERMVYHSLPRKEQHASETSIRLPRSSFNGNSRSQGHLRYPWCCWPGLRGFAQSPRYVGRVRHGWLWYLAGAAGNIFWDGRHGTGMAMIIPHCPITTGLLQWGSFLDWLDHCRRTARQCPWTVTVLALLSRLTTNRQPAWSWYPLLFWWWTNLHLRPRPQQPLGWSIKLLPALKRSTDGCQRTVWSWILRKRNSFGWAVDNSFRRSASIKFISATMLLFPSPQSAISGFILTANWQLKVHVQLISRTSFYRLRQLQSVRRSLSVNGCTTLVHAFVTSRLDYCNSLLAGIRDGLIDQLQTVMRVAARLVLQKRKFDPISADIRDRLHCRFFIRSRMDFKLGLLTTSISMVSLLHTSRRCLYWNQLFRLTPAFARRREAIFLCPLEQTARRFEGSFPEFTCCQTKTEIVSV